MMTSLWIAFVDSNQKLGWKNKICVENYHEVNTHESQIFIHFAHEFSWLPIGDKHFF